MVLQRVLVAQPNVLHDGQRHGLAVSAKFHVVQMLPNVDRGLFVLKRAVFELDPLELAFQHATDNVAVGGASLRMPFTAFFLTLFGGFFSLQLTDGNVVSNGIVAVGFERVVVAFPLKDGREIARRKLPLSL